MPSKKSNPRKPDHIAFYPLIVLTLLVWIIYRRLFEYPIWFDETIGKAVFFGLPVWLYVSVSGARSIIDSWSLAKFGRGLLLGTAFGGMFGFAAALVGVAQHGGSVVAIPFFEGDRFWWEFLMALLTGFWETLFFFSWIMVVIQEKHAAWPLARQVAWVAFIFALFHIPNILLRFTSVGMTEVLTQILILFLFAIGQAFVFARRQNSYALVISQAIWGMVLLVHLS
jgi:hypothetical protein